MRLTPPNSMDAVLSAMGVAAAERVDGKRGSGRPLIERDPVEWVRIARPQIQTKTKGLRAFEPWPAQKIIMRRVAEGKSFVAAKSRQVGFTTAVMIACAHQLLYTTPFHGHVIANKLEVALQRVLRITRRALKSADLSDEQRKALRLGGEATEEFRYTTAMTHNYIRAHAASPDVGHSFDGTHVIFEEVARMPYVETMFSGLQAMLDSGAAFLCAMSTYNGDGDFFCRLIDHAEESGFERIDADWQVHPDRDQAWYDSQLAKATAIGQADDFYQAFCLKRIRSGDLAFNIQGIERMAVDHKWVGQGRQPGHQYVKGIDQGQLASGKASTVGCVIDVVVRPAQVVEMRLFRPGAETDDATDTFTQQKLAWIKQLNDDYPGPCYIDGTNEKAIVSMADVKRKVGVHTSSFRASTYTFRKDENDRVTWLTASRPQQVAWGIANVETGRLIIHLEHFPELFEALKTARKGGDKDRGQRVDWLDALLLAGIPLAMKRQASGTKSAPTPVKATKRLRGLRGRRW